MVTDIRYQAKNRQGGRGAVSDKPPQYSPASWKGVPFYCDSSSDEFGRRGDLYEYPLSNDVAYKDLGRKARRFKVEGWLLGAAQLQINLTREMATKAEDPEPGILVHPIHGEQRVACVTLSMTQDYRKDKKRTRLSFEFVEAKASNAPSRVGESPDSVFNSGSQAVTASKELGKDHWTPGTYDLGAAQEFSANFATQTLGAGSVMYGAAGGSIMTQLDAQSLLERANSMQQPVFTPAPTTSGGGAGAARAFSSGTPPAQQRGSSYVSLAQPAAFLAIVDPLDYAAAIVRALFIDALERLKDFNAFVVQKTEQLPYSASLQALVMTTRLIIAREMAVTMIMRDYKTIKEALDDLDLIMAMYDEEEEEATKRCDDVLVAAIRHARATAAEAILARNIRKPGITEFAVDGFWPSLVVAQKLYGNGQRYEDVENYNPTMLSFWMGRYCIAPAR